MSDFQAGKGQLNKTAATTDLGMDSELTPTQEFRRRASGEFGRGSFAVSACAAAERLVDPLEALHDVLRSTSSIEQLHTILHPPDLFRSFGCASEVYVTVRRRLGEIASEDASDLQLQ